MSLAGPAAFKRRLDDFGVTVSEGPPEACADLVAAAAGTPAVGVPLNRPETAVADRPEATLPDRITTDPTAAELRAAHTGVTAASLGVAAYGSVAIEADPSGTEPVSLFVDTHVAVLHEADLVPDMADAFAWLGPRARDDDVDVVFATGPSATADMGGLVNGAHGPKSVHVVLLREDGEPTNAEADSDE